MKKILLLAMILLFGIALTANAQIPGGVTVPQGGTGNTTYPLNSLVTTGTNGLRFSATSSPTVGYITATSTTATSTFANGITVTGGCVQVGSSNSPCLGAGAGTVSSITAGTGLTGGTITTSGTIGLSSPVSVSNGGTGLSTFSQGLVYSNGGTGSLTSTTSPTVGYITSTSVSTSTFSGPIVGTSASPTALGLATTSPWRTLSVNGASDLGTNALSGSFTATTSAATSTFSGNVMIGTGILNGQLKPQGFFGEPPQLQVNNPFGDIDGIVLGSSYSNGPQAIYTGAELAYINASTTNAAAQSTDFAACAFSGPQFGAYPGLTPNSLACESSDGSQIWDDPSSNYLVNGMYWALGPGSTLAASDMSLTDANPIAYPQDAFTGHLGIATTSAFGDMAINASSTSQYPLINISSSTNGTVNNPGYEAPIFQITSPSSGADVLIGTSTGNHKFEVYNFNNTAMGLTTLEPAIAITNGGTTTGNGGSLAFQGVDTTNTDITLARIADISTSLTNGSASGNLAFYTRNAGTQREDLRLSYNGFVGISTSSPFAPLTVNGSEFINGTSTIGSTLTASNFIATSTTVASTLPYASTTALTVSGANGLNLSNLTGTQCIREVSGVLQGTGSDCGGTGNNYWTLNGSNIFNNNGGVVGNVGVGTSTPWGTLSVAGVTAAGVAFTNPLFVVATSTGALATSTEFEVNQNGSVSIGTSTPSTLIAASTDQLSIVNKINATNILAMYNNLGSITTMFTNNGSETVNSGNITLTTGSVKANGSVAVPALSNSSGITGVYFPSTTSLGFSVNSTEVGDFTNTLFGIGTSSPSAIFSLATTSSTGGPTAPYFLIASSTTGLTGTTTTAIINAAGNFGLSTTTPIANIDTYVAATTTANLLLEAGTTGGCLILKDSHSGAPTYTSVYSEAGTLFSKVAISPNSCN